MNDVENALSRLLEERAEGVAPGSGHREATLRRARRRRLANAVTAGVASLAVVAGGIGGVRALESEPEARPATERTRDTEATAGEYGFRSKTGRYPYAAQGRFRSWRWELRAAAVSSAPDAGVRLTFGLERGRRRLTITPALLVRNLDDGLVVDYEDGGWILDGEVAVVFGAAAPETESVEVWIHQTDRRYRAHVFEGHDSRTSLDADYYVAFVPANRLGLVIAHDADGREVGVEVIPKR